VDKGRRWMQYRKVDDSSRRGRWHGRVRETKGRARHLTISIHVPFLPTSILVVNENPTIQRPDHRTIPYADSRVCGSVMYRYESYLVTACGGMRVLLYCMIDILAVSVQSVRCQSVNGE
jgi:hypothetical protein